MISIIFSCFNEENNEFFRKSLTNLKRLQRNLNVEVICVDGGSQDQTRTLIESHGFIFLEGDKGARSLRYNLGLMRASHPMVVFHHPRSVLMPEGIHHLCQHQNKYHWGAFTHRFDVAHPSLDFTSWYSNVVRGDLKGIYYLDHCLFGRKDLLQDIGGFPPIEIFEDTEICLSLSSKKKGTRLPFFSTTSAVRFMKNGILRQVWINQKMKMAYLLKMDKHKMNKVYEQGIYLNTTFKE